MYMMKYYVIMYTWKISLGTHKVFDGIRMIIFQQPNSGYSFYLGFLVNNIQKNQKLFWKIFHNE